MSTFIWNEEKIKKLDPTILQQVISNMEKYKPSNSNDNVYVRFGTTGKGVRPNYTIIVGELQFPYSAKSTEHQLETLVDQYRDENLSKERFSLATIKSC